MTPLPSLIDFRSDASTLPTPEMRRAMAEADVGNDDFGEDPTVARLESAVAALLGMDDAVFVHSGTMANLTAVMAHVKAGETVLVGRNFHVFDYEGASMERVVGCRFQTLDDFTEEGRTRLHYEQAVMGDRANPGRPRALSLENTVSRLGGTLMTPSHLDELHEWARSNEMTVHLDGARLFNAAAGLGVEPRVLAGSVETVSLALTKAVGAPAGAAVAGSREFTERIRRFRWMLGGNWKQGGVVAAACLTGLKSVNNIVATDHHNARQLAEGLNAIDGCEVDLNRVVTNIVFWEVTDPSIDVKRLRAVLAEHGIVFGRWKPGRVDGGHRCRLVTHRDIRSEEVSRFVDLVRACVATVRP